jgi:hypothetical protein
MTWYALYRRLGGPQGRSERVRKISHPPGFDTRIVQLLVTRFTAEKFRYSLLAKSIKPTHSQDCCRLVSEGHCTFITAIALFIIMHLRHSNFSRLLLLLPLLHSTVSVSQYLVTRIIWMLMNNELEKMWQQESVA